MAPAIAAIVSVSPPTRMAVQTVALGVILLLAAVTRAWSEFDHSNALSYLYVAGLAATLVGLVALYALEERAVARGAGSKALG